MFESTECASRWHDTGKNKGDTARWIYQSFAFWVVHAFDRWITREFPMCKWERYADDGVIHCVSKKQAQFVLDKLKERMILVQCGNSSEKEQDSLLTA